VVTVDLLGSGFSDKPRGGPYDVASLADQAEAVLHHLGMDEAHILAHAYGVTTAQELLARNVAEGRERPLVLRSATFVNGGLFPEGMHPTATQRLLIGPLGPLVAALAPQPYRLFRKKLARNFGPDTQPSERELSELWELLRFKGGHRVTPRVLQYLRERPARRERWVGALQRAAIPLHLINGAADPVAGGDTPALWRQQVPHGRLTELDPGIGHYPPLEQPRALLDAFLGGDR
jgi:pimeloyl-ACP methyl ester carboxylesterase